MAVTCRMPRSRSLTSGWGTLVSTLTSVWLAPVHRRKMRITAPMSRSDNAVRISARSHRPGGATGSSRRCRVILVTRLSTPLAMPIGCWYAPTTWDSVVAGRIVLA
jgi:hypothetical protein